MIRIHGHAFEHGLSKEDIEYAWENLIRSRQKNGTDDPPIWIGIGILPSGKTVELVAFLDESGIWCVFHAMEPPTQKFLKELGLKGGGHGRN